MVRVVQTHTVGFYGPFRSRSVTLLPDPTTLGKPDFQSRTLVRRRTHSELGYLPTYTQKYTVVHPEPIRSLLDPFQCPTLLLGRRTHSDSLGLTRNYPDLGYLPKYSQKYTVMYLEPIRSLLDPFQVSHTIIGTSDSLGLPRTHSELPGLGLSPEILPKVHGHVPWVNPFTIRPFPVIPHYYWDVGRPGRVSGSIPTTASLSRTGWPVGLHTGYQSSRLIPEGYIYISQQKYIFNLITIHTLSPYMSSVTQLYQ